MKPLVIERSQLLLILAFTTVVPLIAVVIGFHLAWQHNLAYELNAHAQVASPYFQTGSLEPKEPLADEHSVPVMVDTGFETGAGFNASSNASSNAEESQIIEEGVGSSLSEGLSEVFHEHTNDTLASANTGFQADPVDPKELNIIEPQENLALEQPREASESVDSDIQDAYLLQTAAFSEKPRALLWAKELSVKHTDVHIFSRQKLSSKKVSYAAVKPALLYVVTVGHFASKDRAKSAASAFTESFKLPVYVTDRASLNEEIYSNSMIESTIAMR